jgi:hypothetical protein
MRLIIVALLGILALQPVHAQRLFVGLETSPVQWTKSSDLSGFPNVTWSNHFFLDVSGAAATPDGRLYLCNGAFTTHLYQSTLAGPPQHLCVISVDISALAYGRNTLWGYSNYADPKGIYAIDPITGAATLVLDVYTGTGYRFFGLDYNPVDDKLYGYTEYGVSGLYRIDIDTGVMTFIASPIPAANSQGRALAVGNNTVYVAATRGDENIPLFAYDLAQGIGGQWVGFTNPYPDQHATGGATWIPDPMAGAGGPQSLEMTPRLRLEAIRPNPASGAAELVFHQVVHGPARIDVLDATGRQVAVIVTGELNAGRHVIRWDGRDRSGAQVAAGAYFARVSAGGDAATGTVRVVR